MQTTKAQISLPIRVVPCLDSIIPLVFISKISSLYLTSVAAHAGLCPTWLQTPKTGFLVTTHIGSDLNILNFVSNLVLRYICEANMFAKLNRHKNLELVYS